MKKNYINPVMKTVAVDSLDSILLTGSNPNVAMGTAFGDGEEGVADTKEETLFGKNLWDDLW